MSTSFLLILSCLLLASEPTAPLEPSGDEPTVRPARPVTQPLGSGPAAEPPIPLDPRRTNVVRTDLMVGPVWRTRTRDTMIRTSVEYGRMHGFSGAFHLAFIVPHDRNAVQVLDVPVGAGAIARAKLGKTRLYGSVGLTAGILIHRAASNQGVVHRVDPDFRVPLRFAWTIAGVGASVSIVQGYSVRSRAYEQRGAVVWSRDAYRIALLIGLHWDAVPQQLRERRRHRRRKRAN